MSRTSTVAIVAASLSLSLAACSRSTNEPAPAPENGAGATAPAPEKRVEAAPVRPSIPPPIADGNMTGVEPPASAGDPDEQMLDDASATGMTARASRGEMPSNEAGSTPTPEAE